MSNKIKELLKKLNFQLVLFIILIIVAVSGIGGSYIFYKKYTTLKTNPNLEAQNETEKIVSAISKLMELPTDETPTVATISDKEKLKDQAFFKTAENGDILLAYTTSMKAILYRPSTKKIINVAPIFINSAQNLSQGIQPSGTELPLKVAFFNGSTTPGVALATQKIVQEKYPSWNTSLVKNAVKKDYSGILVVDLSTNASHTQQANELATLLNGKVVTLPSGETAPDADLLVISGK